MKGKRLALVAGLGTAALVGVSETQAADPSTMILPVDSPAFVFSPANWVGNDGRGGSLFRQTWNTGAYFRVTWQSANPKPLATLQFDTSTYTPAFKPPQIAYRIDGVWFSRVSCAPEIPIQGIHGSGRHELWVCLHWSEQKERWGSEGRSGLNVLRVAGLRVDAGSEPLRGEANRQWAIIVGDSITEGCGASELASYSHLLGQALLTRGYEYAISACGWSGWLNKGDNPPGDVPGYYVVTGAKDGVGGQYDDSASRWNKIDGNGHSLLDVHGHLSAYGGTDEEPALIVINYGTNDILHRSNPDDTRAAITQGLAALRASAPLAQIIVLVPFGQYYADALKQAVEARRNADPADTRITVIDLGPGVARALAAPNGPLGGLHPNDRGHANFAAALIPQVLEALGRSR